MTTLKKPLACVALAAIVTVFLLSMGAPAAQAWTTEDLIEQYAVCQNDYDWQVYQQNRSAEVHWKMWRINPSGYEYRWVRIVFRNKVTGRNDIVTGWRSVEGGLEGPVDGHPIPLEQIEIFRRTDGLAATRYSIRVDYYWRWWDSSTRTWRDVTRQHWLQTPPYSEYFAPNGPTLYPTNDCDTYQGTTITLQPIG